MGVRAEETKEALVDALVRLLRERALDRISVRDIAAEAGVNHGLVHRHFGSKQGLVRAAVERLSAEIHAGHAERPGMSAWTFSYLRERPELARVAARSCLDGPPEIVEHAAPSPERLEAIVAPLRAMLQRMGLAQAIDPHVLNGLATAALLGWFVFEPMLRHGFGLPADADDQLQAALARLDTMVVAFSR